MKRAFYVAGVLAMLAAPTWAQTWSSNAPQIGPVNQPEGVMIHPYPASANYCPSGLQPITLGGVICCGTPTTSEPFYNRAGGKKRYQMTCAEGQKGCY